MEDIKKVALLIDTDNILDKHAEQIYKYAAEKGNVIARRGYGVMDNFQWSDETMLQYAIEPVARVVYVAKKNVTDIALVIDALELAYKKTVDAICIASNDSDFSLLAMKIRELGIEVYGVGTDTAQRFFVAACDDFLRLSPKESQKDIPAEIKSILKYACGHCENESGWAQVVAVATYVKRIYPDFSPKEYGYEKFSLLIKATEIFEYDDSEPTAHKIKIKDGNSN